MKTTALLVALGGLACVADPRPLPSDTDARDGDAATGECRIDADCPSGDACQRARCATGRCVLDRVECDDQNDCTVDTCDPVDGCLSSPAAQNARCSVDGGSESCAGDTYHHQDLCDGAGRCVDAGVEDCSRLPGGACFHFTCIATNVGVGCDIAARSDGTPCTADGLSGECVEGAQHGDDVCVEGECIDAGASACPTAFCEQALCTGAGECAARSIGVERSLSGN